MPAQGKSVAVAHRTAGAPISPTSVSMPSDSSAISCSAPARSSADIACSALMDTSPQRNVGQHGSMQQRQFLWNVADHLPPAPQRDFGDGHAIDLNRAFVRGIKTKQQIVSVVLPAPDGPCSTVMLPAGISSDALWITALLSCAKLTFRKRIPESSVGTAPVVAFPGFAQALRSAHRTAHRRFPVLLPADNAAAPLR